MNPYSQSVGGQSVTKSLMAHNNVALDQTSWSRATFVLPVQVPAPSSIGDAIRAARRRHRLTQEQWAELADTSTRTVRETEYGSGSTRIATVADVADVLGLTLVRAVDDSYAGGYGNSKWAGEVLLREAHDRHGLPVTVFRSDFILAHREYAGRLNVSDMFTRLMLSLVLTGIAPHSFYRTDDQNRRQRAHYDGLPVDFVATAITEIGLESSSGFRTFNAVNPHDDDISLDTFVDWLIESGHHIQRIDYDEWFARVGYRAACASRAAPTELATAPAARFPTPR